ncbi:unnamed protein product [Dicrocoelium dendriticum]|nr:unnamed protein product [Dicrocoelium dendriticum]CAH8508725.1 unnamed protein product [Dicrocoelium dendriticum]
MSYEIVKAGSVQRLSTILKRWKPAWLVIYSNGNMAYFETENSYVPKATVYLPVECRRVLSEPKRVDPPNDLPRNCLFGVATRDSDWVFCAETADEATAWRLALHEAKRVAQPSRVHIPPAAAYGGYTDGVNYYRHSAYPEATVPLYSSSYSSNPPPIPTVYRGSDGELVVPEQVIEHPDGSRTIILGHGNEVLCRCRHGYNCGCGYSYADAALFGLAATSLMWTPFLWSPLFW